MRQCISIVVAVIVTSCGDFTTQREVLDEYHRIHGYVPPQCWTDHGWGAERTACPRHIAEAESFRDSVIHIPSGW